MSNKLEELENLQIPDEQIGRQAVDCLRGYVYQIYQSLAAWLTLKEGETLLLEVAEDFAVVAKDALRGTQVKDTARSGSVTLKTRSVSNTIKSLWEFQKANPDRNVYIRYLTTSKIGKEKELTFPANYNGLTYWRVAAREGTDVEPIRKALLSLELPPDILAFAKDAGSEQLRDQILRRIDWICAAEDIGALAQIIGDRLVYLGERQNLTASDSERARDPLIAAILRKIVEEGDRQLSRADFLRVFDKAVSISMPVSKVRELTRGALEANGAFSVASISGADLVLNATRVPLPPRMLDRRSLVETLISDMGQSGTLWFHGSSGTGKTILAQLIAHRSERDWLLVQLRDCSPPELEFRLCRTLQGLQLGRMGGVILDDFPTKHVHSARMRLSLLADEVHRMNGSLLVTSAKAPSPNVQDCLGQNGPFVVDVPYLSREEVAELVELAGGDAKKWAGVIHTFCGLGHPQLVQARISGLQQRNWPEAELLAGMPGFAEPAKEVEGERDSMRERLLSELSQNTRELLYRLTLLGGYFDRELGIAVGEVDPATSCPGEALDILLGPWVEALASDRFWVSPLVSSAGSQTLGKAIKMEVHKRIVDQLITRRPFPADFLGTLLVHALGSRHARGLTWLTMAILNTGEKDRRMISEHLLILPLLATHQPLFKENIHVSAMLRLAQFRVAVWANRVELLPAIADQLINESRMLEDKAIRDGFICEAISSILIERALSIRPQRWLLLLTELDDLILNGEGELIEYTRTLDIVKYGLDKWKISQFLFMIRATSLRGIDELIELFTELDQLEVERRKHLLSALNALPNDVRLMIDSAWLFDTQRDDFSGVIAANKLQQVGDIAEKWSNTEIAVECACSCAVMLDEYADDCAGALSLLDSAEIKYPKNLRLMRQRGKVYYHSGDHSKALLTIEQVADAIAKDDHIERAFALREAAISAGKTDDPQKAGDYFAEAYGAAASAGGVGMQRMAIGLRADCALVKFQSGDTGDAIQLIRQAIVDAEQLDPKADTKACFCRLMLPQVILWMESQVKKTTPARCDFQRVVGCCSNPDPPDRVMDMPCPPLLASWYHLAVLELMLRANYGIMSELRSRTRTHKILSCELILNYYVMAKYVLTVDIENFFSYLPEYVSKTAYMRENPPSASNENMYDLTDADLSAIEAADWKSELDLQNAKDVTLALVAAAVCSDVKDIRKQLLGHLGRKQGAGVALRAFIDCFERQTCPKGDAFEITAYYLGRLMKASAHMSPDEMFIVSYRLWEWLPHTLFGKIIEDVIADYLSGRWREIITNQRFNLKQAMMSVPAIEGALKGPTNGIGKIAAIVLAAENAVKHKLNAELRAKLANNQAKDRKF